jgi:cell filamentation protein
MSTQKISIRCLTIAKFVPFKKKNTKWWFSVLDIVGILNNESDYAKNHNY